MFGLYAMDGRAAVRRGGAARHGPRPARQEDVEVVRQRGRPAGLDRPVRRRRHPVHAGPRRQPRRGRAGQRGVVPGLAQLLQQAVERDPLRADERRDRRRATCRRRDLSAVDRWILSRLQHVIAEVDEHFEAYEFAKVCDTLYHFAWDDVCDWYVELSKPVLAGGGPAADATRRVLGPRARPAAAPAAPGHPVRHRGAVDRADRRRDGGDRGLAGRRPALDRRRGRGGARRAAAGRHRGPPVPLRPGPRAGPAGARRADRARRRRARRARAADPFAGPARRPGATSRPTATLAVAGGVSVELDTRGTIDVAAERARLEKDRAAAEKEAAQCRAKLDNPAFIAQGAGPGGRQDQGAPGRGGGDLARIAAALDGVAIAHDASRRRRASPSR